jgi:hypothetical protein
LSFAELQWPAMEVREKSRRGLGLEGFSVDWVLCELTRRAGLLRPWRGDRQGSNGGRFGGDSSLPGLRRSGRGAPWLATAGPGPALACCPGELGRPGAGQRRRKGGVAGLEGGRAGGRVSRDGNGHKSVGFCLPKPMPVNINPAR